MFWDNNIVNIALKFSFVYFQNDDLLKLLTLETFIVLAWTTLIKLDV